MTELSWQLRLYLAGATSVALIVAVEVYFLPRDYTGGFVTGYGVASVLAFLFLAAQRRLLRSERDRQGGADVE